MKKIIFFFAILIAIALIAVAKAAIFIPGTEAVYNLGDPLSIEIKVFYPQDLNGFFRADFICQDNKSLLYFSPLALEKNKEKSIKIEFPISRALGPCFILAALEDSQNSRLEETQSSLFLLTDEIKINATIGKEELMPGDEFKIEARAVKANGKAVDGTAEIIFDNKQYLIDVSRGKFSLSLNLSSDAAPGQHQIAISVEDKNNNRGNSTATFKVAQIPTSLVIETNNESFLPNELLMITPKLLDQVNNIITQEIHVNLIFFEKILFFDKETMLLEESVQSNSSAIYKFAQDARPGNYFINANTAGFEQEKLISVQKLEKINFSIENSTLYIFNVGNVPYKKQVELLYKIQNQTTSKVLELGLEVGQSKAFKLEAPKGTYEIEIKADNETKNFAIPLTGSVIATIELKKTKPNLIFWLIAFIALVIFALLLSKRKKYENARKPELVKARKPEQAKAEQAKLLQVEKIEKTGDSAIKKIFARHASTLAASTIMSSLIYGTKQELTFLFVNILGLKSNEMQELKKKNPVALDSILSDYFASVVSKIKAHQGIADLHDNFLVVVFNVIKQYRHDTAAIKTAQEIRDITKTFNNSELAKKYGISFVVKAGINTGLATVSSIGADKSLHYTAIGNTTTLAKALERKALENEILLAEMLYNRVSNVIKARKVLPLYVGENKAINVYALEDASPSELKERHRWYVDRALGGFKGL